MDESRPNDELNGLRDLLKRLLKNEDVPEREINLLRREIARLEKIFSRAGTQKPRRAEPFRQPIGAQNGRTSVSRYHHSN
jgi:hypothetical protein